MSYFIGSMVPDEVRAFLSSNRPEIDDVRWTKPEKYHITFEYFPDLSNEMFKAAHRTVQALSKYFPLKCELNHFSGFPSHRKARVIIALISLDNSGIQIVCENKRFNPHVTVGYARNPPVFVPQNALKLSFSFARPALYRSEKGIYTEIETVGTR
ncbi:MAG: hypothetical protein F4227_05565 [Gammaproteobacteria bacterium]|nr:hypothetical protein [Gammaproteobacteria bacterium]MYF02435.1 hypothetical protein [Gammaproteobacteria bacterium]MYI76850.1 hypothetical protein [Gammaproteobacteria bacterium]